MSNNTLGFNLLFYLPRTKIYIQMVNKQLKEVLDFIEKEFKGSLEEKKELQKILEIAYKRYRIKYVSEIAISEEVVPTVSEVLNGIHS